MAPENSALPYTSDMEPPISLPDDPAIVGDENKVDDELKKEESWEVQWQKIPLRVDNRYTEEEGLAIIEVLVGHSRIAQEISRETVRRRNKKETRTPTRNPKLVVDGNSYWIQQVRIQSPQLILLLSRLTGQRDKCSTGKPFTFFAPFCCFYYHLQQLKECLKLLEAHWPAGEASALPNNQTEAENSLRRDGLDEMAVLGDVIDSHITRVHLTTFVDFLEKHIMPLWHQAAGTKSQSNTMYQTTWRIFSLSLFLSSDVVYGVKNNVKRTLGVEAYYLDYDGISYVPVYRTFNIKDFEGERDIATLEIYPLRFIKDGEGIKKTLHERGTWFRQAITEKHLSCDGWTLTCGPTGISSELQSPLSVDHIDGDVIIDFVEGYKSERSLASFGPSSWKGRPSYPKDIAWREGEDYIEIIHWKPLASSARLERFVGIREEIFSGELYSKSMQNEQINGQDILKNIEEKKLVENLDEKELLLLPSRVVAYTIRERRFVMLDIQSLKSLLASDDVFKDLKIDPSHKTMVISLVKTHLEKQAAQKLRPSISMNQDIVRGKGSGLVILLHGVPGVGKTATAEAIAQTNKKPLFAITCGDLDFTPKEVEESLKDIFRLAHLWDCVLLLDEADVFLSRRELGDLKRNALVSVFLRVLEYYSGILFLTTNRVGTLDEAFKSRIHVSLYYPPLDRTQTTAIFDVSIRKIKEIIHEKEKLQAELDSNNTTAPAKRPPLAIDRESILHYAEWHYDTNKESPQQRWNGRFTPRPLPDTGLLNWRQFDMVAKSVEKLESYLYNATNGTDSDRARTAAIREDQYDHRTTPQKPAYSPHSRQWRQRVRSSGQNTAPNPFPGNPRQYRPPRPASRDERAPLARNPRRGPDQLSLDGSGSGAEIPRKNLNTGGLFREPSGRDASPQFMDSRPPLRQTQRQHPARETNMNSLGNKAPGAAPARRSNPGHHSRWDINTSNIARRTPDALEDQQEYGANDSEDEGYGAGDRGNYEDEHYGNGEDDLDRDRRYIDDGADAEPYDDYDGVTGELSHIRGD
ncbi:hypothetical protein F4825DRAFT_468016 [Nemania diffusa]|nr:hypothetical protein F4825DRAFT_468016 [Nemania diffusa]